MGLGRKVFHAFAITLAILLLRISVTEARQFAVPKIETTLSHRVGHNNSILFNVIDMGDGNGHNRTACHTTFKPSFGNHTYFPKKSSAVHCGNKDFQFYFSSFSGISNFTLEVLHTYKETPTAAQPQTLYAKSNPINHVRVPGFTCRAERTDVQVCSFHNRRHPILIDVIPTTTMQRKREEHEKKEHWSQRANEGMRAEWKDMMARRRAEGRWRSVLG